MATGFPGGEGGAGRTPPPIPVARTNNNSCLLAGLAGCGVLVLLGIGFVVFIGMKFGSNKEAKNLMQSLQTAPKCGLSLGQVQVALEDYRRANEGKYPPDLGTLVPNYMHPSLLDSCGGNVQQLGSRLQYVPPRANTPPDAPVVSVHFGDTSIFGGASIFGDTSMLPKQVQTIYVRLLKDGRVVMDQVTRTEVVPAPGKTSRGDSGE